MVEIKHLRKVEKGTLKSFFTVILPKIKLQINDYNLHCKNGKHWINLPSKSYQDENNNTKWASIIRFTDKKVYERFQQEVLEALSMNQDEKQKMRGYFEQ